MNWLTKFFKKSPPDPLAVASPPEKPLKLNEAIKRIEDGDFSDDTREALYKALRRCRSDFLRCQHCWILAYNLGQRHGKKALAYAVDLIDQCFVRFPDVTDYERGELLQYKGNLYFKEGLIAEADQCFKESENTFNRHWVTIGLNRLATPDSDFNRLKTILLRDNFTYSLELEQMLNAVLTFPQFGLRSIRLYIHTAKAIVFEQRDDSDGQYENIIAAKAVIDEEGPSEIEIAFKQNRIVDKLDVPQPIIDYIEAQYKLLHKK